MRLEADDTIKTSQGKTKRTHKVVMRFLDTGGGRYGADESLLDTLQLRTSAMPMDQAVPLFSGDKVLPWPDAYNTDAYLMFKNDQPTAATLVGIYPQVVTQDSR